MANLLIDLSLTSADTLGGSFADITDMSQVVDVVGPDSVIILTMSLNPEIDGGNDTGEYQFTHDGSPVGAVLAAFGGNFAEEGSGRSAMQFFLEGLSAGSHTFAVQGRNRFGTVVIDTAFVRTFQAIEILSGASLLVDLATVVADTAPASFADMAGLSDTQTPADGAILLFNTGNQLDSDGDESAEFHFAIDGGSVGPEMMQMGDNTDRATGLSMTWAEVGVSAASHTFSVRWELIFAFPIMDEARQRIFQVLEITADADLLVDNESLAADTAPASYADMVGMSGTPSIDSVDSIALVLANYTMLPSGDDTANNRVSIGGVQEGAEISIFSDTGSGGGTQRVDALCMVRAVTGEVGATTMALQWVIRDSTPEADTNKRRTFQVIDFTVAGANMAGSIPLTLTPAAALQARGELAGSSDLAIALAATLQATGDLAGSSDLAITLAAAILATGELAGSSDLIITPSAAAVAKGELAGSADLVITPAATLAATGELAGAVALLLTPAAAIQATGELIGSLALVITPSGDLAAIGGNLAGEIPLILTATGTLEAIGALAGAATITLTPSGTLQATGGLLGTSTLTLALAGDLKAVGELLGTVPLVLTPSGTIVADGELSGSAALVFTASGILGGASGISGTIPLTITAAAQLLALGGLAGGLTMTITPAGVITANASISGSADLVFTLTGALPTIGALAGSIDITIDPSGTLIARGELSGSTDLSLTAAGDLAGVGLISGSAQLTLTADGTLRAIGELQGLAALAFALSGNIFDQSARRIPNSVQSFLLFLQNSRQDLDAGELNSDQSITAGRINSEQ